MTTPPPSAVARFRDDVVRLAGVAPQPDRRLGVAVSGGPDSLALLLLAHAAFPGCVAAATVDHELRAESADEALWVAELCHTFGIPHEILRKHPRLEVAGVANVQERARLIRYACLGDWAKGWHPDLTGERRADWVATAHHLNDVAEGFLMRAVRGSGVRGLARMAARGDVPGVPETALLRPLLDWSRDELAAIVRGAGIDPVADPSNTDDRYTRVRFRRLLADHPDLSPSGIAQASAHLRDAEDALEWLVLRDLAARFEEDENGDLWLRADDLPFELQRRFVVRAVTGVRQENLVFDDWDTGGVAGLIARLKSGTGGTIADVQARVLAERWHFRMAPPRRAGHRSS